MQPHSEASEVLVRDVPFSAVQALTAPAPDRVVSYGELPQQFGELWLPADPAPAPVLILIHGGCWRNAFGLDHVRPLANALRTAGFAVWSIEYRRLGDAGGGWPGTFLDVAQAADQVRALAEEHPLDLTRVVSIGHSAGGHLALWLARRDGLTGSDLEPAGRDPLKLHSVVGLAAIVDLAAYSTGTSGCERSTLALLEGTSEERSERYALASPAERPPLVPVSLIHGDVDSIVAPSQANALGSEVKVSLIPGAGHFDVIHPHSVAWPQLLKALQEFKR